MEGFSHYSLGPSHCCDLLMSMDRQRTARDESVCDIRFVMGNDCVYAHRSVLAACSAYFQGMLSGAFMESQGEGGTNSRMMEVDLSGSVSTRDDLDVLLSAIYTGSLKLSPNNIMGVTELACFLLVDNIREVCERFLLENLSIRTCLRSICIAHRYDLTNLFNSSRRVLQSRFHDHFIHQPEMLTIPAPCLKLLFRIYKYVRLHDVLQFLMQWVDNHWEVEGESCVEEERVRRLTAACDIVTVVSAELEKEKVNHIHQVLRQDLVGSRDVLEELCRRCVHWVKDSEHGMLDSSSTAKSSDSDTPLLGQNIGDDNLTSGESDNQVISPAGKDGSGSKSGGADRGEERISDGSCPCDTREGSETERNGFIDSGVEICGDAVSNTRTSSVGHGHCTGHNANVRGQEETCSENADVERKKCLCDVSDNTLGVGEETTLGENADVKKREMADSDMSVDKDNRVISNNCKGFQTCGTDTKCYSGSRNQHINTCDSSQNICYCSKTHNAEVGDDEHPSCSSSHGARQSLSGSCAVKDTSESACSVYSAQDRSVDNEGDTQPTLCEHSKKFGSILKNHVFENSNSKEHTHGDSQKRKSSNTVHPSNLHSKERKLAEVGNVADLIQMTDVVVAFVPDKRAVKYFTATDCERNRPRYCPVEFHVCVYHIIQRRWLWAGSAVFPDKFEERDAWRVACVNCKAYFVSVGRRSVHVLDLRTMTWGELDCRPLMCIADSTFRVRSLVPLAVSNQLYVLASNKEPLEDGSDFCATLQQYFLLDGDDKWRPQTIVQHTHMATPLTLLSVSGNKVYVVKATIPLNLEKSILIVQEGHIFDTKKGEVKRFKCGTYAATPLRILVRDGQVHIVDGNSAHRRLGQDLGGWKLQGSVDISDIKRGRASSAESHLPCLTYSSTLTGSSVWEFSTSPLHRSALTELHLENDGKIFTRRHTPPPFYYVTITTACQLSADFVTSLEPCHYLHADDVN